MTTTDHEPAAAPAPVRQAAYDAIYAFIRSMGDQLPPDPAHRNALIWRAVETALDAMNEDGRLLPPEGEVETHWAVRFTELLGHASPYVQPYSSEHVAREYAAADWRPHRTGELVNRRVTTWPDGSQYIGPWSPVVSDNSSEGDATGGR